MSRTSPRLFVLVLVNACAVIAACYIFEFTAVFLRPRWFGNEMVNPLPDGVKPGAYDRRSPMAVVVDARKVEGPAVYPLPTRPVVGELFHQARTINPSAPRPLAGVSKAPTIFCAETSQYTRYTSDRYGFNNADTAWERPAAIALVGDSFVQGNCVHEDSTIAAVLRHDGVNAISLGVSGNGPLSDLAIMREFALRAHPRVVGWVFYEGNDLCDLDDELRDSMLATYLERPAFTQRLVERQSDVDAMLRDGYGREFSRIEAVYHGRVWSLRSVIGLGQLRSMLANRVRHQAQETSATCANLAQLRHVLTRAHDDAMAAGVELAFIYLPSSPLPNTPAHLRARSRRADVLLAAHDVGLRTIDLTDDLTMKDRVDRVWNFPMSHYTTFGYALVAHAIERALTRAAF
jgi:hypothetical protein